jgi:hypothetical protein
MSLKLRRPLSGGRIGRCRAAAILGVCAVTSLLCLKVTMLPPTIDLALSFQLTGNTWQNKQLRQVTGRNIPLLSRDNVANALRLRRVSMATGGGGGVDCGAVFRNDPTAIAAAKSLQQTRKHHFSTAQRDW